MPRKAILAGGSGFLGQALARRLLADGWEVVVLTRSPRQCHQLGDTGGRPVAWDARTAGDWSGELDGADALVNFAGRSVRCVHTDGNRRAIRDSRVHAVEALGAALAKAARPPGVWVQCSGIGYYGPRGAGECCDESTPPGDDFLARVCRDWEAAFHAACPAASRGVVVRLGMVLGREGGAFPLLAKLARAGLGGTAGGGRQGMSWIHVDDAVGLFVRALADLGMRGAYNACAPEPVANADFMRALRRAVHRPWSPPAPAFAVRLAARCFLRTDPSLVLDGQYAVPARLQAAGHGFVHPHLDAALRDLAAPAAPPGQFPGDGGWQRSGPTNG